MAVENIKSAPITNLDTVPAVPNTVGEGGPGNLREADGFAAVSAGSSISSTYRLVRLPSNAKVKTVELVTDGNPTAGAVNVGLAYSDSTIDGTAAANQGTVISASLFAAALTLPNAAKVDATQAFGFAKRQQPLWQAAGLSADPGGFFDVLLTVSTAVTSAVNVYTDVRFAD